MTELTGITITKIRFQNGIWEGRISGSENGDTAPDIRVLYLDQPVAGVTLTGADAPGTWDLAVPVPSEAVADGVHSFLIIAGSENTTLAHFTLIGGHADNGDLRTEVDLLRAELDMLKRAFRRHCVETS